MSIYAVNESELLLDQYRYKIQKLLKDLRDLKHYEEYFELDLKSLDPTSDALAALSKEITDKIEDIHKDQ